MPRVGVLDQRALRFTHGTTLLTSDINFGALPQAMTLIANNLDHDHCQLRVTLQQLYLNVSESRLGRLVVFIAERRNRISIRRALRLGHLLSSREQAS